MEGHISYDSTYVRCPERADPRDRWVVSGCRRMGKEEKWRDGSRGSCWRTEMQKLDRAVVAQRCERAAPDFHLEMASCMSCALHVNTLNKCILTPQQKPVGRQARTQRARAGGCGSSPSCEQGGCRSGAPGTEPGCSHTLHQLYDCFMICPVAFTGALKSWNPAVQDEEARRRVTSQDHVPAKHRGSFPLLSFIMSPPPSLSLCSPSEGRRVMERAGLRESEGKKPRDPQSEE